MLVGLLGARRRRHRIEVPAQRCQQRVGFGLGRVEAADEAGEGPAAPVELEAVGFERSIVVLGSSRKISLASTGANSRAPARSRSPVAMRAAIAFEARAMSSQRPFSI